MKLTFIATPGVLALSLVLSVTQAQATAPQLFIQQTVSNQVELSWQADTNYSYEVAWTAAFQAWRLLGPPLAVPAGGGWMTNTVDTVSTQQFFRLAAYWLTNSPVPTAPGVYAGLGLVHDGLARTYRLHIPTNYTGATPVPLALILHGHNQTADGFAANHPALAFHANTNGMILVLPDSTRNERGTSWYTVDLDPTDDPVDDIAFILALIDHLDATLNIDRNRVCVGGFSNGGMMTHYLAGRTTNVFAAVAAVGSAIAGQRGDPGVLVYNPPPPGPIAALIVNATNDCGRPYWGGLSDEGRLQPAVWESVAHYTNANLCAGLPLLSTNTIVSSNIFRFKAECGGPYPPPNVLVTNLVIREWHAACTGTTEVLLYTLTDGGHTWPDVADNVGFDANHTVIEFLSRHALP